MKIGGLDTISGKTQVHQESAVKNIQTRNDNSAKELDRNGETVADWQVSDSFLKKAVEKANQTMTMQNRYLEFKIHEKTNEIIVKVIDSETKEVIREIPSEKILDMFASMLELAGLLMDERR